mmetsp:Transcript_28119/g.74389  ORF Transcript_28119/g.74389 Transcript_28119/m.74389 type:complete len:299 (-) Transcript_28119:431-1327(-)
MLHEQLLGDLQHAQERRGEGGGRPDLRAGRRPQGGPGRLPQRGEQLRQVLPERDVRGAAGPRLHHEQAAHLLEGQGPAVPVPLQEVLGLARGRGLGLGAQPGGRLHVLRLHPSRRRALRPVPRAVHPHLGRVGLEHHHGRRGGDAGARAHGGRRGGGGDDRGAGHLPVDGLRLRHGAERELAQRGSGRAEGHPGDGCRIHAGPGPGALPGRHVAVQARGDPGGREPDHDRPVQPLLLPLRLARDRPREGRLQALQPRPHQVRQQRGVRDVQPHGRPVVGSVHDERGRRSHRRQPRERG